VPTASRQGFRRISPAETLVSIVLGLLLFAAAVLKLAAAPDSGFGLSSGSRTIEAAVELSLALWLFSGKRRAYALGVTGLSFLGFATVALTRFWARDPDCGCFGPLHVPPSLTFWIDSVAATGAVAAVMALLGSGAARIVPWILLPVSAAAFAAVLTGRPIPPASGSLHVGMTWPFPGFVDLPSQFARGRLVLLIHDPDCHRCVSLAESLAEDARQWAASGKNCRLALVEEGGVESGQSPPPSGIERWVLKEPLPDHRGPILALLQNGRILAVEETWQPPDWSDADHAWWVR